MKDATLTHKDLARQVGVSETTIKSYRRKFEDCIPVASLGKPIRFTESALQVCLRIQEYFDTGMSSEEVRARLVREFSWIPPQKPAKGEDVSQAVVLPQDFTQAVSNLAKSMVTLTQQQGAMLRRLEEMEKALAREGTSGASERVSGTALPSSPVPSPDALYQALMRLERLDAVTEALQSAVSGLAAAVGTLQPLTRQEEAIPASSALEGAKIYRFPPPLNQQERQEQAQDEHRPPQDPPRHLLALPLVVQGAQGGYIGAGGRSRGRFTLNDLKALVAYGREPSEQYTMRWEYVQDVWWLVLEQPNAEQPRLLRLQLRELTTQRGLAIAEVTHLVDNSQSVHPAELCSFVTTLCGAL